jgi:hypothetical protein
MCRLKKATEAHIANREKQEKMSKLLQSGTVDGLIIAVKKPRAIELEELSPEERQACVEKYKAFKRLERKLS